MKNNLNSPKERILITASTLFHQNGYNSTGINQIIKEAKVAKASFYYNFDSKDNLCIEYLNHRHTHWFSKLNGFVNKSNNRIEKILLSFDFIIYMNQKENFRGCSFLNILSEISEEQKEILFVIQNHKNELKTFFKRLVNNNLLATQIYLVFESAITESQLFKSNEIVEQSKQIINKIVKQ